MRPKHTKGPMPKPLAERFWRKVNKDGPVPPHWPELGPCWLWTAATNGAGYGKIGAGNQSEKTVQAHHVAWGFAFGPLPEGVGLCHHCDNPPCVNPSHLFVGNQFANMADMTAKGRRRLKLTTADVLDIREAYSTGRITQRALAERHGVSDVWISAIVRRRTWVHI